MTKPKLPIPSDLLKSVTTGKPAEHEGTKHSGSNVSKAPAPKVKASTKPARTTVTHTRSTNRGK